MTKSEKYLKMGIILTQIQILDSEIKKEKDLEEVCELCYEIVKKKIELEKLKQIVTNHKKGSV